MRQRTGPNCTYGSVAYDSKVAASFDMSSNRTAGTKRARGAPLANSAPIAACALSTAFHFTSMLAAVSTKPSINRAFARASFAATVAATSPPERLSAQHQRFASRSPRPRHLTKPARVLHDVLELFEVSGQTLGRAVSDAIVRHDAQTGARESFKQVRVARGVFADAVQKHDDGARFALGRVLVRA